MINKIDSSEAQGLQMTEKNSPQKQNVDFKDTLKDVLGSVNELQQNSGTTTEMFVRGEITDLHQVMIDAQKARVGLELLLEVRNKLVEGYQEIMRMQI